MVTNNNDRNIINFIFYNFSINLSKNCLCNLTFLQTSDSSYNPKISHFTLVPPNLLDHMDNVYLELTNM